MKPIVVVECLSKQYRLGESKAAYATVREALTDGINALGKRIRRDGAKTEKSLWALKDVSFDVQPGEVVGIIGRNGAGKSTLLKILSRITEPTSGRVDLYGRVGSLLEVGTGFHPELSGRENIYLNGAILGMRKTEIERKFDEIVDFSEIEQFIDTPVKRYSSGMYVRLAFAVAAYLEPDILIVDEVLAVGDMNFQKKCLGKMKDVTQQGRTVLFVSHNMMAVKSLCNRAILLDSGHVVCDGGVDRVTSAYLTAGTEMSISGVIPVDLPRSGTGEALVQRVEILDQTGGRISQIYFGQPFRISLTLEVTEAIADAVVGVGISSLDGSRIATSYNIEGGQEPLDLSAGVYKISVDLKVTFLPQRYTLDVFVVHSDGGDIDVINRTLEFEALGVAEQGTDHYPWSVVRGFIRPDGRWHLARSAPEISSGNVSAPVD
jgi:homopolymeric O-antigen transport system ATP-binding protein